MRRLKCKAVFSFYRCHKADLEWHCNYWVWFDFCFTALHQILGHFERGQLSQSHCSCASLLGSLPVLSAHSFASNWQLLFLNQRRRENGRRNLTKLNRKNVPDVGIEPGAACMASGHAYDRADTPGAINWENTMVKTINPYVFICVWVVCHKKKKKLSRHFLGKLLTTVFCSCFLSTCNSYLTAVFFFMYMDKRRLTTNQKVKQTTLCAKRFQMQCMYISVWAMRDADQNRLYFCIIPGCQSGIYIHAGNYKVYIWC